MKNEQVNRKRKQHEDKGHLSVSLESSKKFNSEFDGTLDALTLKKINSSYNRYQS